MKRTFATGDKVVVNLSSSRATVTGETHCYDGLVGIIVNNEASIGDEDDPECCPYAMRFERKIDWSFHVSELRIYENKNKLGNFEKMEVES